MQQGTRNKKSKGAAVLFWVLSAICMGVIFYFSSQTGEGSQAQSNFVIRIILRIFPFANPSSFVVRKAAHFLEYTGLCLLLNSALVFTYGKPMLPGAILIASLYSVTDEIHQIFVDGRSCQITDWAVDTLGAMAGALAFSVIYLILEKIVDKRRKEK